MYSCFCVINLRSKRQHIVQVISKSLNHTRSKEKEHITFFFPPFFLALQTNWQMAELLTLLGVMFR